MEEWVLTNQSMDHFKKWVNFLLPKALDKFGNLIWQLVKPASHYRHSLFALLIALPFSLWNFLLSCLPFIMPTALHNKIFNYFWFIICLSKFYWSVLPSCLLYTPAQFYTILQLLFFTVLMKYMTALTFAAYTT